MLGRDVSGWQDDQFHTYGPRWGADYLKFDELRKELGLRVGRPFWGRMGSMPSPNAESRPNEKSSYDTDRNGEKRLKRMMIIVEVYPNKEAAELAAKAQGAGGNPDAVNDPSYPGGKWSYADWKMMKGEIAGDYQKSKLPIAARLEHLAKLYDCEPKHIEFVVNSPL
ncbi:hypothetical protein [Candidatus Magnetobacterium casense]|uniref:Uncharacterized protein n=1 Tax=Candidatus Magnetobacterium casense TaxID=1455061 RepID=A0ABS6S4Z5_9BACT|nr:hypothetical protein [Candidatus Magnetobacterium casensis]MBV6343508.1 hypothetical protein [Candidatus Magnetobacterium casensis]